MIQSRILELCGWLRYYPSGDNCQPFLFSIVNDTLHISSDATRMIGLLNQTGNASRISLGSVIFLAKIVGPTIGIKVHQVISDPQKITATIVFQSCDTEPNSLIAEIKYRRTHRKVFSPNLNPQDIDLLAQNMSSQSILLKSFTPTEQTITTLMKSESSLLRSFEFLEELFFWLRDQSRYVDDGMLWEDVGLSQVQYSLLNYLIHHQKTIFRTFVNMGGVSFLSKRVIHKEIKSSQRFVAALVHEKNLRDPNLYIEVGETMMRLWLNLSQKGFGAQPLSFSSILPIEIEVGQFQSQSINHQATINFSKELAQQLNLNNDQRMAWLFRVGTHHQSLTAIRRATNEIAIIEDSAENKNEKLVSV